MRIIPTVYISTSLHFPDNYRLPLRKPSHRFEDNIKTDIIKTKSENVD